MSDRAVMKRRVRGLLYRKWLTPLCALLLAALPMLAALLITTFLMDSFGSGIRSILEQIRELFATSSNLQTAVLTLMYQFELDLHALIAGLPALAVLVSAHLFVGIPISVSLSGYFLSFLRGKEPKLPETFSCFSGAYPRILGGMLYKLLWSVLWGLMAFVAPFALYSLGLGIIDNFAVELGFYQIHVMIGLIVLCIVWFVIFVFYFFNRAIAYSLTGIAIAAQPRLEAYRAVRLSRKLMRGYKWQLIALFLSFLGYYVPALLAGVLLLLLPGIAPLLGLSDPLLSAIRIALYAVAAINLLFTAFVAPYMAACFRAFYIERKREALMDDEVTQMDFTEMPRRGKKEKEPEKEETPPEAAPPSSAPIAELGTEPTQKDEANE